jgi:hypothetical protein
MKKGGLKVLLLKKHSEAEESSSDQRSGENRNLNHHTDIVNPPK